MVDQVGRLQQRLNGRGKERKHEHRLRLVFSMPDRDLPYCETTKRTLSSFYLLLDIGSLLEICCCSFLRCYVNKYRNFLHRQAKTKKANL